MATQKHKDKAAGIERAVKSPEYIAWEAANVATKRYHCKICDQSFNSNSKLSVHNASKKHKDNAANAAESLESSS
jgi:hypothetical protein